MLLREGVEHLVLVLRSLIEIIIYGYQLGVVNNGIGKKRQAYGNITCVIKTFVNQLAH
jgi:hypothetical protein